MKGNTLGKVLNTDLTGTGTWSTHGCLWWRIYMTFSIAKVHWETNCSAECHLPCINSPDKEHLHRPGTTLAAFHGQRQVICVKKIFQKVQKQRSYNLFIYITLLEFPLFSLAKISERRKNKWVPSAAHALLTVAKDPEDITITEKAPT